jgi:hypothetical protein
VIEEEKESQINMRSNRPSEDLTRGITAITSQQNRMPSEGKEVIRKKSNKDEEGMYI